MQIKHKLTFLFLFTAVAVLMCGCTLITGAESYLKPPKLSEQHEQIYKALMNASGSKINLKYPKSGNYLSAFVVADIDDEPTDEALVFYEKTIITGNDVSSLRINFLDQDDNHTWRSVFDFSPADASEVERVFISELGASQRKNIIIGIGSQNRKNAQLYYYDRSSTEQAKPVQLGQYSEMDVRDLNSDGMNELIIIHPNSDNSGNAVQLKWLSEDNVLISGHDLDLNDDALETAQMLYGKYNETSTAIYIDYFTGTNKIKTDILYPEMRSDKLELARLEVANLENEEINGTVRQSSLTSKDIDDDGIVEIPINTVFKGYEEKPETEQVAMTNWYTLEDGILVRKYSGYYSITDGYAFMLPSYWLDKVTVKTENDDIIFTRYDESDRNQAVLLRLCVVDSQKADSLIKDKKYAEYVKIPISGNTVFLACIPKDDSSGMVPSMSDVQFSFKPIYKQTSKGE